MKGYCTWLLICLIVPIYFAQVKTQRSGGNTCSQNEIPCDNSDCIARGNWCDGDIHCMDRSDEQYCKTKGWFEYSSVNDCNEKHYECDKGPCVPIAAKCDGFEDCKGGSDEYNCDKTEENDSDSEETTTVPHINTITDIETTAGGISFPEMEFDSFFDNDDDNSQHDNLPDYHSFEITTTSETVQATSSPSYVAPIISVSQAPVDDYYVKKYTENTNGYANFDYNKAQSVNPRYSYNQQISHSKINPNSRREQIDTRHTTSQYDSGLNIRQSGETVIKLPPRAFPGIVQPSITDTRDTNNHGSEGNIRSEHSGETLKPLPLVYPRYVESSNSYSCAGRHCSSEDTIVKLPPRLFPGITQSSVSATHYPNSQHVNENNVRSGYSSRASVTSSSHTFPPTVQPSISRTRGNEANVRSGHSDEFIVRLPPRIFLPAAQPSTSEIHANGRHSNTEKDRSWEQGRTLTSSADSPAVHLDPYQLADHDNSAYGLQSDSVSRPENYLQRNSAPFSFKHNYTQKFGYHYKNHVQRAKDWILSQRNVSFGWGKDTPRALVALSLMTNTFSFKYTENELMKKSLATGFGIRMYLMREKDYSWKNTNILTNSTLATYVNALLATCQDPKNFFSNDLAQELLHKTTFSGTDVNPFVYLTLCVTNTQIDENALPQLVNLLTMNYQDERSSDMQILATTALACLQRQDQFKTSQYKKYMEDLAKNAFKNLIERRLSDYSFGSKYSTALAAQALMSIDTNEWRERDAKKTLDLLAAHQLPDGSFGDMLATYLIVPALSGRSLLHLRNTECDPVIPQPNKTKPSSRFVESGPVKNIYYTIKVGYPETQTITTCLEIGANKNFLYAMEKAEDFNSQFKFLYKVLDNEKTDVHTIKDIPNDTERGFRWRLFSGDARQGIEIDFRNPIEKDVAELIPENYREYVYWYLPMIL